MPQYTCFLISAGQEIVGRENFEADDDATAVVTAFMVRDACADLAPIYSLWQGRRCVVGPKSPRALPAAFEIRLETQERAIRVEETLRDSRWRIAKSVRLLETIESLRGAAARYQA